MSQARAHRTAARDGNAYPVQLGLQLLRGRLRLPQLLLLLCAGVRC
jgi:hypothetical protein